MATRGPEVSVTDDALVSAVRSTDRPFATTKEVSEAVGLSGWRTRQRLDRLDEVKTAKVGRSRIYWLEN